jgi:integrase
LLRDPFGVGVGRAPGEVHANLAASNPVRRVKFFNEDNSRLRYLTEDEYNRLVQAAKTIKTSPLLAEKIVLSVHTGLRRGSLFHLRWTT